MGGAAPGRGEPARGAGRRRRRRRGAGTTGSRAGSRPARPRAVRRPARAPLGCRRGRCARGTGGRGAVRGDTGNRERCARGWGAVHRWPERLRGVGWGAGRPGAVRRWPERCAWVWGWGWGGQRAGIAMLGDPGAWGPRGDRRPHSLPTLCASYLACAPEIPGGGIGAPLRTQRARLLGQGCLLGAGKCSVWNSMLFVLWRPRE